MAIGTKQQHRSAGLRIRNGAHAAKGTCAVMKGMGCDGDPGLLERHALTLKPGVGQELMHRWGKPDR